ncbi:deoxyribose-phosphate aldolase [Corynebacterium sp. H127]|uniref:deoxyribose-phosphate aldolase n=1 Tax=Corynebacterium sp. H127 TaxID=3133418 RepID=UPI0030A72F72
MSLTPESLAPKLEYELLDPLATAVDVEKLLATAQDLSVPAICVAPHLLPAVPETELQLGTVCGFPTGMHHSLLKATEARFAVQCGAIQVDLVPNLGAVQAGDWNTLLAEIVAVREAITDHVQLTVVLENAVFSEEQLVQAARTAVQAGANNVKAATGFHPAGGATVAAVRALAGAVPAGIGVKAGGGIETFEQAAALIDAGATALAVSRVREILAG